MGRRQEQLLCGAVLVACLGGCGWFNDDKGLFVDRRDDYIDARIGPELVVPEDLPAAPLTDPLPIPPTPEQASPAYYPGEPPLPTAISANDNRDEVRIQRLGSRLWLVVPEPPGTLWPKVKQFLSENAVAIGREDPGAGRLDTEWLAIGDEPYRDVIRSVLRESREEAGVGAGEDRLLIRIEQGLRDRSSELHLRQQSAEGADTGTPTQLSGLSSERSSAEQAMLNEIGAYVAARVAEQTVSMVAQNIATQPKSQFTRLPSGQLALRLNLDPARAWATVGQALERAEVKLEEADEQAGRYRIVVTEEILEGEPRGRLRRLFSFGDNAEALQVQIWPENDRQLVAVYDYDANPVSRELAQQLLNLIIDNAS